VLFVFGLQPGGIMFREALHGGLPYVGLLFVAILTGAFITPALLPFIPFRSFALKGLVAGAIAVAAASYLWESTFTGRPALAVFSFLFFPALSSYLALQFTGATTYTGISGVKKELKISIPLYMGAAAVSVIFLLIFKLGEWGVI
jgi:hypothetical protein